MLQVALPFEEFAEDLDLRLGRANGNVYHRRPGIENVHDGQVMVRLKKKRFIVIDYSIVPTDNDRQVAAVSPHVSCPPGAGKQKCATPECPKVGVPVLLYDSDPSEPSSLYMRSGLCFVCQRNLNEKRRTQRKRPGAATATTGNNCANPNSNPSNSEADSECNYLYALTGGPNCPKKVKVNDGIMELDPEAIILRPPPGGVLSSTFSNNDKYGKGSHGLAYLGLELQRAVQDASFDTERLVAATTTSAMHPTANDAAATTANQHEIAAAVAAAVGTTAAATTSSEDDGAVSAPVPPVDQAAVDAAAAAAAAGITTDEEAVTAAAVAVAAAAVAAASAAVPHCVNTAGATAAATTNSGDIASLYEKALHSMTRSMYLLSQWKQSWDTAVHAAVVQESGHDVVASQHHRHHHHHPVGDPTSLADAVASAAAVAAATTTTTDATTTTTTSVGEGTTMENRDTNDDNNDNSNSSSNMVSLLLAANQRKGCNNPNGEATASQQTYLHQHGQPQQQQQQQQQGASPQAATEDIVTAEQRTEDGATIDSIIEV